MVRSLRSLRNGIYLAPRLKVLKFGIGSFHFGVSF